MGSIKVYNLDSIGVVVDSNPIANPDGQLTKAQNAVPDPIGEAGSLKKRPGLKPFNATAASGSTLGAVGVPITIGSASPIFVSPFTDTPVTVTALQTPVYHTNTVRFGGGVDDNGWSTTADPNLDYSDIDEVLEKIARIVKLIEDLLKQKELDAEAERLRKQYEKDLKELWEIIDAADEPTAYDRFDPSFETLDLFDTHITTARNPGPANRPSLIPIALWGNTSGDWQLVLNKTATETIANSVTLEANLRMKPFPTASVRTGMGTISSCAGGLGLTFSDVAACIFKNKLYYAAGDYVVGSTAPTIHCYDGFTDQKVFTFPNALDNAFAVVNVNRIQYMIAQGDVIYFTTQDGGTSSASTAFGSVYQWDPVTGVLTKLGAQFTTDQVPMSLCWAYSKLWCGTVTNSGQAKVYWIRPLVDSTWTLDNTFAAGTSAASRIAQFNGLLYVSTYNRTLAGTINVYVRAMDGTYTSSDSGTVDADAGQLANRAYIDLLVWPPENSGITSPAPALYATRSGATEDSASPITVIRKLSAAGGAWSTTKSNVSGGYLQSASVVDSSTGKIVPALWNQTGFVTTDGTNWTDNSALITISGKRNLPGFIIQA